MFFDGTMEEFENIVNRNKLLLYSVAYAVAGNFEVDDVVQETFIYAYYHFGSLKNPEKLSAWLCAIARNKAYDSIKKRIHSGNVSMEILGEAALDISTETTPETLLLQSEASTKLLAEINSLSEKYRETVLLYYFADKSIKEISDLLSVPEGTIKFRLSEARKKLKKELKDMFDEERSNIVNKNIFEKIKEETQKAENALNQEDTKSASELCDAMLMEIQDIIPKSKEEMQLLYSLYQAKIGSIIYAEGLKAAEKYIIKCVEISEASGDCAWMSASYSFYAAGLSNMGRKEESTKYYKKALEKAEETCDTGIIADKLYWNGNNAYLNKTDRYGLDFFERVLSMKEPLLSDTEHEVECKNAYALSYSAYTALKRSGVRLGELEVIHSTAPAIALSSEGLSFAGQPGFSKRNGNTYCTDVIRNIAKISPFLSEQVKEGFSFVKNTISFSHTFVRTVYEVVSMDEKIASPAGSFEHCLHTRYTDFVEETDCELNKENKGVTDVWYAPKIGVVCYIFTPIQGNRLCMKLKSYKIEASAETGLIDRYLPLEIGNQWSYEAYNSEDVPLSEEVDYENLFEVVCRRNFDNAAVIAHSGWGARKVKS